MVNLVSSSVRHPYYSKSSSPVVTEPRGVGGSSLRSNRQFESTPASERRRSVVPYTFSKCADLFHFRHLLSPKTQFIWTEDLDREFELAKASIVRKIHKGVTMFKVDRITALVTDWSKEGQSLGLWQKHCSCQGEITILCCKGGWKIVFMSSRFNNDAQSRYSPIEGKCLTLYWAINKCDYFLYGCDKLYVGTDHRPLLAFF